MTNLFDFINNDDALNVGDTDKFTLLHDENMSQTYLY